MSIFDYLSNYDKDAIESYIERYALDSSKDRMRREPLDEVLSCWTENKKELFKMFGNSFTISKSVSIQAIPELKAREMEDLWRTNEMCQRISSIVENTGSSFWTNEIECHNGRTASDIYALWELTKAQYLVDNKFDHVSFSVRVGDEEKIIKVENGCRPVRAIMRIAKEMGGDWPALAEQFRLAHSRILNDAKLVGTLTLSIHPLDFMTMSDNFEGWSSCMSWDEDGCYRAGTIEMMNSPYVVIAYLSHKNMTFDRDRFEWNSKSWRCLFVVTPEVIASIKNYPYHSNELTKTALNWLVELSGNAYEEAETLYTVSTGDNNYGYATMCSNQTNTTLTFETEAMYNDFGCAPEHLVRVAPWAKGGDYTIDYSGPGTCMCCGRISGEINGDNLTCTQCIPSWWCVKCNTWHFAEEMAPSNRDYCQDCWEESKTYDILHEEYFVPSQPNNVFHQRVYLMRDEDINTLHHSSLEEWRDREERPDFIWSYAPYGAQWVEYYDVMYTPMVGALWYWCNRETVYYINLDCLTLEDVEKLSKYAVKSNN